MLPGNGTAALEGCQPERSVGADGHAVGIAISTAYGAQLRGETVALP